MSTSRVQHWIQRGAWIVVAALMALGPAVAAKKLAAYATSADLGGTERYLAHVSTDKPIYRAGEPVYVRCVILHAANHTPVANGNHVNVRIVGPKGETVTSGYADATDSVSGFSWTVPEGQAGGEYTVKVTSPGLGFAPAERTFDIRAYRAPRLKTQIEFIRDGYGPGDTVRAALEATRAEGGIPDDAKVTVTARLDGSEIHRSTTVIDRVGNCSAEFKLPAEIARGEGTIVFSIEDGGVVETATKTIPILLQTVDLSIYPEGGELVADLPNRVYIEARTPAQKPADLAGIVVDGHGQQVASFRTAHEGRGSFVFKPRPDEAYQLRISEPAGIKTTYPLPPVKATGVLIQAREDVYPAGAPVELRVRSSVVGPLTVTLSKREAEVAALTIKGNQREGRRLRATVKLTPPASADGVLTATVWDVDGNPLAERLVYREPAQSVHVRIEPDHDRYVPGGTAGLTVTTTDAEGNPIGAVVGMTVTDDSVLEMIETREQAPRLPVMVLLEGEVRELADAHVYLDPENDEAPRALDLLLGTQGWRRFALIDSVRFLKEHGDAGRRVLAMRVVTRRERRRSDPRAFKAMAFDGDDAVAAAFAPLAAGIPPPQAAPVEVGPDEQQPAVGKDDMKHAELPEPSIGDLREALEEAQQARDKERLLPAGEIVAEIEAKRRDQRGRYASIRVYAHKARSGRKAGDRVDFTETLYWAAAIKTDAKTGQASVGFDLNDSVTSFRVLCDAFTKHGALGSTSTTIESVRPFYVEPKLPLEVTMGDRILLPVGLVNGTSEALSGVTLGIQAAEGIDVNGVSPIEMSPDSRVRRVVELLVGDIAGPSDVVLDATAGAYADRVTRTLRVVPRGFPIEIAEGGMLKPNGAVEFTIEIPKSRVPGSVTSAIAVYPTPLANLTGALERLIREPSGCFEQTSSTTYPLVMAQQYFMSHHGVDPQLIERSKAILARGYKRLLGFECKSGGYEWFGSDPAHEALTAYGLLEFTDMAKVYPVDPDMLKRTRAWLLGQRDGKGGFKRERRALHTWVSHPDCSNAYIVWALLESGEPSDSLRQEVDSIKAAAQKSENSYVMALGAIIALHDDDAETARGLMTKLAGMQTKDGYVDGATMSIVGSRGSALQIETTSLAMLAWLQDDAYVGNVERSITYLADSCKGGRYGSTQSTVLALRAILAYDKARSKPKAAGSIQLTIDGHKAGSAATFDTETHGAIELTDIAEMLEPGTHRVRIAMTDGSAMPFALAVNYSAEQPVSSKACKVGATVTLNDKALEEGEVTEARVEVWNRTASAIPTPIAIIGVPGGLEVRHDQLKELVSSGKVAAYEVLGREVVLYWRGLEAEQKVSLPISMVAEIPGTYTGPASRVYEYYGDEFKHWVAPLTVAIEPKR